MTQPFDKVESSMGISSYMSTKNVGFAAVLKARYSDFVVHEVNRNGQVARLESLVPDESMAQAAESSRKRKHPDNDDTKPAATREEQWTQATSSLAGIVGDDAATEAIQLLQYWQRNDSKESDDAKPKFITLPEVADKDARRSLHESIRSQLNFCALSDTDNGRVRIWHKRFEKQMANYGKFDRQNNHTRKKTKWPSNRPDFLQFVLYKENMDTSFACKEVIRQGVSQRKGARIGYAGMKDKRGVTSQFCTLYRQEPTELAAGINKGGRSGGGTTSGAVGVMRVGNFEYVSSELSLGMLSGNRFDVVLRNVDVSCAEGQDRIAETKKCLEAAAVELRENGFINYFGMQRFGKYYDTHLVGLCLLNEDFEGAVDIILRPKPDEMPRYAMAREKWSKRFDRLDENATMEARERVEQDCARDVLRQLGRFMTCEQSILNSLARKPCDYRRAFGCIAKTMRMMFLHAVQSFIWNHVASSRVDTLGREVVEGDLVLTADNDAADGGSASSGLGGKIVKVVDAEDIANKTYSMTDVVLPLVGSKIQYPENKSGDLFDSLLADQGVTKKHFSNIRDRDFSLKGDYRKLVCKPADVDFEILEYSDPLQPLLKTDLMQMEGVELNLSPPNGDDEEKSVLLGMLVGFTLPPSSYATITLRELMRRPTSSDYQKLLKLQGKCEEALSSTEQQQEQANTTKQ